MDEALLDTNVFVYALGGSPPDLAARARQLLASAVAGHVRLHVTAAVVAEAVCVLSGWQFRAGRTDIADGLGVLLRQPGVVGDEVAAIQYGLIRFAEGLDFVDGYLAGLARERGMAVATHNVRHFESDVPVLPLPTAPSPPD